MSKQEYNKRYYELNKEKLKDNRKKYYIDNKEKELENNRIYRENNPEKIKEIYEQLKEDGYFKEYNKQYVEKNRDKINLRNKEYVKQFEHDAVYLLANVNQEIIYIGSTNNLYKRINGRHKCGNSNLKLTKERWIDLGCDHFEFCHVDGLEKKEERLYIERELIKKYNPILNIDNPLKDDSCISDERKAELETIIDDIVWKLWTK